MMQDPVKTCDTGCCVEIDIDNERTEKRLLEIDDPPVPSPTDPCEIYTCEVIGEVITIKCLTLYAGIWTQAAEN